MIESYLMLPPALGVLGLLIALGIFIVVNRYPEGDEKVKKIGFAFTLHEFHVIDP